MQCRDERKQGREWRLKILIIAILQRKSTSCQAHWPIRVWLRVAQERLGGGCAMLYAGGEGFLRARRTEAVLVVRGCVLSCEPDAARATAPRGPLLKPYWSPYEPTTRSLMARIVNKNATCTPQRPQPCKRPRRLAPAARLALVVDCQSRCVIGALPHKGVTTSATPPTTAFRPRSRLTSDVSTLLDTIHLPPRPHRCRRC
jgi:hypothetical protein